MDERNDTAIITLCGDLSGANSGLARVRDTFRKASATGKAVHLDFSDAGKIDAGFLGLVLMLEKSTMRNGVALTADFAHETQRRIFTLHKVALAERPVSACAAATSDEIAPQKQTA